MSGMNLGEVKNYPQGISVRLAYVQDEISLVITRSAWGASTHYVLGHSVAHEVNDEPTLVQKAMKICKVLRLGSAWDDVVRVCDILLNHLDDLVMVKEHVTKQVDGKKRIEHALEHQGLKVQVGGETVLG